MVWDPAFRVLMSKLALPPLSATAFACVIAGLVQVPPSINVTVPEGVPPPGGVALTVASNVTASPKVEGLLEEVTAVDVAARLIVSVWVAGVRPGAEAVNS